MCEPLLEVRAVESGYGDLTIVHGIDLSVEAGERVLIFGPNGSGKSTLLKTICGLVPPRSGSLRLDATDLTGLPAHRIAQAGLSYVPQTSNVFADLTVAENLEIGGATRRRELKRRRDELFDLFPRLGERRNQLAGSLSGGERQLVAMGRALMVDPKVLLLDEPSAGLSPAMAEQTFDYVRAVNEQRGVAILLVEQNVIKGMEVAQRGYLLETGRVKLSATTAELAQSDTVKHAYLGG
jgi:ABC-type branched-subunit amino acid transport system ATPase component